MKSKHAGWRREPARHALAAKGISTGRYVKHQKPSANQPTNINTTEPPHCPDCGAQMTADTQYSCLCPKCGYAMNHWSRTKYCGYVVGRNEGQITPEQVERLFQFLHANYTATDFIQMNDKQLHEIAEDNQEKWRY